MPISYTVRIICETETGDGKGFHYHKAVQVDLLDDTISCPDHIGSVVRDFVGETQETV